MNELASILNLIVDSIPPSQSLTLESIMGCNEENFRRQFEAEFGGTNGKLYFSVPELKQLMDNSEGWTTVNMETNKRVRLLHYMLTFTQKPHLEMMELGMFRDIVTPEGLKLIMSKSFFVNYTLQMNQINKLTLLQGLYLRTFIKIHMHADLKFKAVIDSSMIDIDHPYIRQTIREENRKDSFLSEKYIHGLQVENLILRMIDEFFPGISGIWIDHNHLLPASVLQFTLECFEYGFISPPVARQILIKLTKATTHLIKLEEGWSDRLSEVNKFSDMIKANNITSLFAKNREIMALLLIQILVTISDSYFLETYDKYIHKVHAATALNPGKGDHIEKNIELELMHEFPHGFAFYDKSVNDSVLYITMNYLSETVYLSDQRGMSANSKVAVEKLFLYITSTGRDVFLNSLKGVDSKDLRYFSTTDVVAKSTRDHCDKLGATLRELLRMISMQMFDRITGALSKDFQIPKDDSLLLNVYIPTEAPTLPDIIQKILNSIQRDINKDESLSMDVKVALVKESVPLALLSIADYVSEFFGTEVQCAKKAIIDSLILISKDNNYCKGQLFKSDGCYHLLRLMRRLDHSVFLLLTELCNEANITNYVCNEFYTEFMKVYIEVEDKVRTHMPNYMRWAIDMIHQHDADPSIKIPLPEKKVREFREFMNGAPAHLDLGLGTIFILMNKVISKTYRKEFLNELEKLQGAFQTQEVIYQSLAEVYIPHMVDMLQNTDFTYMQNVPKRFGRLDFVDGNESTLIESLESIVRKPVNTELDEKVREDTKQRMILEFYVCFSTMRAFNTTAVDCTSSMVQKAMNDAGLVEKLKYCVFTDNPEGKKVQRKVSVIPQNLEIEVITFLRVMEIFREQNCLMEGHFNPNNTDRVRFKESNTEPDRLSKTALLLKCISHTDSYLPDTDEAKSYIYEGLLPLVYDTMKTFQNLSNYDKQGGASLILQIRNELSTNLNVFNELTCGKGKVALDGVKFGVLLQDDGDGKKRPRSGLRKKSQDKLATTSPTPAQADQQNDGKSDKKKESKNETLLKACCDSIKEFLDAFYKVAEPMHQSIYAGMHDITHEDYEAQTYVVKFDSGEDLDTNLSLRKRILNLFLKTYQKEKENYFERAEEPNLSSYFDRNSQNLRGLFNSCLDRLLNQTKFERFVIKSKLTKDYALSRFWMSRSCFPYLKMLERLLTKSKTCRKEFFAYFREYESCEKQTMKKEPEEISKKEKKEWINSLEKMKKAAGNRRRDDFFGVLCRIHCDLLMYLNDSATQNLQWWVVHQTYETISNFFKNLCECNFKEFKEFFSLYVPPANDLGWREEIRGAPLMLIFAQELNYLQLTSRVSRNKESMMVFSDMIEKIHPLLLPLMNLVNEAVTGPCTTNQQILLDQRVQKFIMSPAGQKLLRPKFSMKTNMDPMVQKILLDVKAQKSLDTQGKDNVSQADNQVESKRQIDGKGGSQEGASQQNTFQSPLIDAMVSLPMRLVDEMDGEFAELAVASLNLLLSCLEGSGELNAKIIKSFSTKVHPAVLEDRITRLMKLIVKGCEV